MRIAILSSDRHEGRPLFKAIVELLRAHGFAGATVLPCIMGFGARRVIYSELSEIGTMSGQLPVIVEAVESTARIAAVLPELDRMITGGVITLERARVISYRAPGATSAAPDGEAAPDSLRAGE